jgi:hypothetical protein
MKRWKSNRDVENVGVAKHSALSLEAKHFSIPHRVNFVVESARKLLELYKLRSIRWNIADFGFHGSRWILKITGELPARLSVYGLSYTLIPSGPPE